MGVETARCNTISRPFMRLKPQNIAVQVPAEPADAEVRVPGMDPGFLRCIQIPRANLTFERQSLNQSRLESTTLIVLEHPSRQRQGALQCKRFT